MNIITNEIFKYIENEHKFSQSKISELINVNQKTISNWKRGVTHPDINHIQSLCELCDMEIILQKKRLNVKENFLEFETKQLDQEEKENATNA